jgi:hypothetical protein
MSYTAEVVVDKYPYVSIGYQQSDKPFGLVFKQAADKELYLEWFETIEEAETKAHRLKATLDKIDEANKRLKELFRG